MSEPIYERYKDALRRGHVAALRGRLEQAIDAYVEAAGIATERPLPHTSLGGVLVRLGRIDEALASYEAALERAPRDESALHGRAEALARANRPAEAADALDLVAEVEQTAGRLTEAIDTARRALELAESKQRRRHVAALARQLRETPGLDQAAEQALARALRLLEPGTAAEAGAAAEPGSAAEEGAAAEAESPEPEAPAESEPLAPPEPPSDPIALRASADEALDRGDGGAAREALLSAARAHAADGGYDAALDACYLALAVAPGDADLHLELVDLYLARGWRAPAAEKLVLLERLLELDGDEESRGRVRAIAAAAFPDDPNLAALRS